MFKTCSTQTLLYSEQSYTGPLSEKQFQIKSTIYSHSVASRGKNCTLFSDTDFSYTEMLKSYASRLIDSQTRTL